MRSTCRYIQIMSFFIFGIFVSGNAQPNNAKLRIIIIGAHPDDCEGASGTAALFAQMGYAVKFVSVTNGDAGHQTLKGKQLAKRRYAETQESANRLGIEYEVFNIK